MQAIKKEIDDMYYLETTSNYIVVNDAYHGIIILDFALNTLCNIGLDEDTVINFSIKHKDEMLLFCYENECAFYVNLEKKIIHRYELSDYSDTYFSQIYFWKENEVYLFANGGELCVKLNLSTEELVRLSPSDLSKCILMKQYMELVDKDMHSYDNDKASALIVQNSHYCIWYPDNQTAIDMSIPALNQKKDEIPSDEIYCKTSYSDDIVIHVSEKKIMVALKGEKELYITPPYETYRFFEGKLVQNNVIFALCNDNSSENSTIIVKYENLN